MGPEPKTAHVARGAQRRKLSSPTSKLSKISIESLKSTRASKCASQVSPRRLWRSNAPRAQHLWQVSAKAIANTENATELDRIYALLCQAVRRNKNQHRSQGWWRVLMGLRRAVGRLVRIQMEAGLRGPHQQVREEGQGSEGVRKRLQREAEVNAEKTEVESFLRDVLLVRCYVAFSSVVRDPQFAALGVVLMGVLARIGREVGLPESRVEAEVIRGVSMRQTGVDTGEVVEREWSGSSRSLKLGDVDGDGEVREGGGVVEERARRNEDVVDIATQMGSAGAVIATSRNEKKKKGRKSAIDDLFAGLI